MNATRVSTDEIYPVVEKSMKVNKNKFRGVVQKYIETRADELYAIAPYTRIYFRAEEEAAFWKAVNINPKDITTMLSHTYYWEMNFNPRAAKDEFTMVMMNVIRYFLKTKDQKNAELASIYLAFSKKFYPSIHMGLAPNFEPDKYRYVMDYVVNNMLSQKFDLKREGSVFGAVRSICITWLNTYKDILIVDLDDEDMKDIIQQLHGRIKSFLANIMNLYYKAYADKDKYITYDSDSEEQDSYRLADNDSLKAARYVENTMNRITMNSVDYNLCKMASDSNVKVNEVKSIIESIQDDPNNIPEIKELVSILITEYMVNSKDKDVGSIEFVSKSIASKPNTKNKNIIRQKEIIEHWLDENSAQYRKRKSREATKSSYYKSVLTYYVLQINKANK